MRYVILAAVLIGLCGISGSESHACSCVKPEVHQAFNEARAVFVGEVAEIIEPRTDDPKAPLAARLYSIRFKIEKAWKGASAQEITILSDQGRAGCFSWGPFIKGEKYVVYAEKRTPAGVAIRSFVVLFSCNRTALLANASEDLEELGKMSTPPIQYRSKRPAMLKE